MITLPLQKLVPHTGWRHPGNIRIPPMDIGNTSLTQRLLLSLIKRAGKLDAANLWLLLMHNVRLLRVMLPFASQLMPYGELDRRDTELVILRVGWNCRCRYEWGQHVDIGLRAGLSADEVMRVPEGPEAEGWNRRQMALLKAADEIHSNRMVSDLTWKMLTEFLDQRLLIELLMLIGFYEGLAGVLNSAGLPLDASNEAKLDVLAMQNLVPKQ